MVSSPASRRSWRAGTRLTMHARFAPCSQAKTRARTANVSCSAPRSRSNVRAWSRPCRKARNVRPTPSIAAPPGGCWMRSRNLAPQRESPRDPAASGFEGAAMSEDFLRTMADSSRERAEAAKAQRAFSEVLARARDTALPPSLIPHPGGFDLISEVKLRSPAAGVLKGADEDVAAR